MVKKNKLITASNFKDFDWNKAKLFYHIAKSGSFTKAARLSDIDQSVLTRQIQILETQVGCPLLVRKAGGVSLTRKGEELLKHIAPFFMIMRGFCSNNHSLDDDGKRKIKIATTHALSAYVISDIILDYSKENPHLIFELIGEDHVLDVILNDVDIAIRPYDEEMTGVIQEPIFTLEKKLYASRSYIEKYGEPQTIDDLKNHHLIAIASNPKEYPYSDIHWILKVGIPKGQIHKPVFLSNSVENMINAAKKGIGIIGSYEEMSILRDANLVNILPDVKDNKIEWCLTYPEYLKEDKEISNIKSYLYSTLKPK